MSVDYDRMVAEETLILDVTEQICRLLDRDSETNRKWLAEQLGCGQSHVSQLLGGERNMTLRTLARIADALGQRVVVRFDFESIPGEKSGS